MHSWWRRSFCSHFHFVKYRKYLKIFIRLKLSLPLSFTQLIRKSLTKTDNLHRCCAILTNQYKIICFCLDKIYYMIHKSKMDTSSGSLKKETRNSFSPIIFNAQTDSNYDEPLNHLRVQSPDNQRKNSGIRSKSKDRKYKAQQNSSSSSEGSFLPSNTRKESDSKEISLEGLHEFLQKICPRKDRSKSAVYNKNPTVAPVKKYSVTEMR